MKICKQHPGLLDFPAWSGGESRGAISLFSGTGLTSSLDLPSKVPSFCGLEEQLYKVCVFSVVFFTALSFSGRLESQLSSFHLK